MSDENTQGQGDGQQGSGQQSSQSQTQSQQAQPFDPEALKGMVADTFRTEFEKFRTDAGSQQQQQSAPQPPVDPMARIIAPYVAPALQNVALQAQAAMDAATFYAPSPVGADGVDEDYSLKVKWRGEIESKFQELVRNGGAVPRADIFNWMIGGPKRREYIDFVHKQREDATQRAQFAQTASGGSTRMGTNVGTKSPDQMNEEELLRQLSNGF